MSTVFVPQTNVIVTEDMNIYHIHTIDTAELDSSDVENVIAALKMNVCLQTTPLAIHILLLVVSAAPMIIASTMAPCETTRNRIRYLEVVMVPRNLYAYTPYPSVPIVAAAPECLEWRVYSKTSNSGPLR